MLSELVSLLAVWNSISKIISPQVTQLVIKEASRKVIEAALTQVIGLHPGLAPILQLIVDEVPTLAPPVTQAVYNLLGLPAPVASTSPSDAGQAGSSSAADVSPGSNQPSTSEIQSTGGSGSAMSDTGRPGPRNATVRSSSLSPDDEDTDIDLELEALVRDWSRKRKAADDVLDELLVKISRAM